MQDLSINCDHRCQHNHFCEALAGHTRVAINDKGDLSSQEHHTYDAKKDAIHYWKTGNDCRSESF